MHYPAGSVFKAEFICRPNRFIAHCLLDGKEVVCHVKNTGRCRELLVPGTTVYLCRAPEGSLRKTLYDLIAVQKGERLINLDSSAPNLAAGEFLRQKFDSVKAEVKYRESRVDFLAEKNGVKTFVEVKGVTLEENGIAAFPDAPTERGIKHLEELCTASEEGYKTHICFILQMEGMSLFRPNDRTHPAFGNALRRASEKGVSLLAMECAVSPYSLSVQRSVPISLSPYL